MKHQRIAIAVLLILAVLAAEWIWLRLHDQPSLGSPLAAAPAHVTVPGDPFALTDHRGQAMSDREFRGRMV
ncbi:MAG: SCO family protein [Rhodospirillales bacterium]|nr:SCO family protein [Rhodospirillales bacterium]MDH3913957.1 SCO family protein [Rhodospirillales bacterium]MDH3918444.1 SCO family protein [Rhodospirillales bacterium]MDH3966792.1 SCO family protein [Rhodospirillales bacterium]